MAVERGDRFVSQRSQLRQLAVQILAVERVDQRASLRRDHQLVLDFLAQPKQAVE